MFARASLAALLFSSVAVSADDQATPFGVRSGTPSSALGIDPQKFTSEVLPPNPHPDFASYLVQQTEKTGVCLIEATSARNDREIAEDRTGQKVRELFEKVQSQLEKRYGVGDVRKSFEFFDPGDDWVDDLANDDVHLRVGWFNLAETSNLSSIVLQVRADRNDLQSWIEREASGTYNSVLPEPRPYVLLQYKFRNWDECSRVRNASENEVREDTFEAEASTL